MTDQQVEVADYGRRISALITGCGCCGRGQRPAARTHHLQVVEAEHPHAQALLAFRDAPRADAGLRREYASLKERLAQQHPDNRNAYTNAKASFVERTLKRAGVDHPPRDLLPE